MSIFSSMFPSEYSDSFYSYDFESAYRAGRRLILFDIDNTMVPHGAPPDERCQSKVRELKSLGFKLCAVSNNKEPRVSSFCSELELPYVFDAGKPAAKGYRSAMKKCGMTEAETIFFGDQIFTDILGALHAGIHCVLVRPIDRSTDEIQIRFKRILEKPVITAYFREKGLAIREYFN